MRQSTQHNCENESTVTQKRVLKWSVHFKTEEKRFNKDKLFIRVTPEEWGSSTEKCLENYRKSCFT